jgi:hypothetical protein
MKAAAMMIIFFIVVVLNVFVCLMMQRCSGAEEWATKEKGLTAVLQAVNQQLGFIINTNYGMQLLTK